jgi:hypothetical protein
MTKTLFLRRAAVLAASAFLAIAIGAKPLYAANDDSTPKAENGSKKTEKKDSKKTTKVKSKKTTGETATGAGQNPGYRPEAEHGSGY